jgi:hypothetical protein
VREREQQDRAWLAWHTAALPRMKTFPTLRDFTQGKAKPAIQTTSEMRRAFSAWRAAAGAE